MTALPEEALSTERWTEEHIPVTDMVHDVTVNPRDPSTTWARRALETYDPALLGVFVLSERLKPDGSRELAILDGANRAVLVRFADDQDRPMLCQVFHGLSREDEASIARRYNNRRQWLKIRIFQALCAEGDKTANAILSVIQEAGWEVGTTTGNGIIRGVGEFERFLTGCGLRYAAEVGAQKGTAQWDAAMVSGEQTGLRLLGEAFSVFTAAFPVKPGSFAPTLIYGLALVLARDGSAVDLERFAIQLRDHSNGHRQLLSDARTMAAAMRQKVPDAVALVAIQCYNKGLASRSAARLDERWERMAL